MVPRHMSPVVRQQDDPFPDLHDKTDITDITNPKGRNEQRGVQRREWVMFRKIKWVKFGKGWA